MYPGIRVCVRACHLLGMTDVCFSKRWSREQQKLYSQAVQQGTSCPHSWSELVDGSVWTLVLFSSFSSPVIPQLPGCSPLRGWLSGTRGGRTSIGFIFPKDSIVTTLQISAATSRVNIPNLPYRFQFYPDEHFLVTPLPFFQMKVICLKIGGSGFLGPLH